MTDYPQYPGPPQGGDPNDPNNPYRYGMPAAPPATGYGYPQQGGPQGPRPSQVLNAVRLMYIRAGIGVISLIVLFATKNDLKKRIEEKNPALGDSDVNNALVFGAAIAIVVLVLYVALAIQVSKGKNWARIVTWVIGGLAILGFLGGLAQPETPISRVLGVITVLIDITVVVLLALKPSNDYFRKPRYY